MWGFPSRKCIWKCHLQITDISSRPQCANCLLWIPMAAWLIVIGQSLVTISMLSFTEVILTGLCTAVHCQPKTQNSKPKKSLKRCHNEHDRVSNHQRLDWLLSLLCSRRSRKTSKLRVTGLCEGNPPVTGGFPYQRASDAGSGSIWWRYHVQPSCVLFFTHLQVPWTQA